MAQLRMIAIVAFASCRAEAAPAPPAGWRALPEIAAAVGAAVKPDAISAWGDPAKGCYAVRVTLHGHGDADAVLAEVRRELTVADVVMPSAQRHALALSFTRGAYHGRLHAMLDKAVDAAACFWNQREPAACEATCTSWIAGQP